MKNLLYGILLAAVVICLRFPATCEPALSKFLGIDARHIIGRTAAIISNAQQVATQGQNYGGLGLAVSHQLLAVDLYAHGDNRQAIFHSLRARVLASQVITQNKNNLLKEALFDRIEEKYTQSMPSGPELDQRLRESKIQILSDQAAANPGLVLDI